MKMTRKYMILYLLCGFSLLISACGGGESAAEEAAVVEDSAAEVVVEDESAVGEDAETEMEEEQVPEAESQATPGQEITFTASDGTELQGIFYPADSPGAPLVIMMHWAPGDQSDYVEMAYWLQNRGLGGGSANPDGLPWLDPSWFPMLGESVTYNVFTFTFRQCEGGCSAFLREEWLIDAQSAVEFAYGLEGIDQENIVNVGASIGSDGAADGCLYLNEQHPGACKGAFSISAGDYLTLKYKDVVKQLGADAIPAWCLYAISDVESSFVCGGFEADNYTPYEIGDGHGMMLVRPDVDPNPLDLMLEFFSMTIE